MGPTPTAQRAPQISVVATLRPVLWAELSRDHISALRAVRPFEYHTVAQLLIEWLKLPQIFNELSAPAAAAFYSQHKPSPPSSRPTTEPKSHRNSLSPKAAQLGEFTSGVPNREGMQTEALLKFYVMNLRWAIESGMTDDKVSAVFSVLKLTHFTSMDRSLPGAQSLRELQSILVTHAIDQPPQCIGLFSPEDVRNILDFAADTYYRHYRLYRVMFTTKPVLDLHSASAPVEHPPRLAALAEGTPQAEYQEQDLPVEPEPPATPEGLSLEAIDQQIQEMDQAILEDPKSELIQELVQKRLEAMKEELEAELAAKREEYMLLNRDATLPAK